jgi:aminopeptidase
VKPAAGGDPYVPGSGDDSYHVEHYDLAITYRPASNRLDGTADITATARRRLDGFGLDLAGLTVAKVTVDGRRPKKYAQHKQKLVITLDRPIEAGARFRVVIGYAGRPRPLRSTWGDVGWDELREGSLVAGQPIGARSWFPANDHPRDKATYRIAVTTDSPFTVVANGTLTERRTRASTSTWIYDQPEPMATYLATVQIGNYDVRGLASSDVAQHVARPARLARAVAHDFGRQDEMMTCFGERFGPYPFAGYTVVVTDDPLEIPLEAQGLSVFGSNHLDGRRTHERLVAHELAHQWFGNSLTVAAWSDIWLNEGFACYAEWVWSEYAGEAPAHELAQRYWKRLRDSDQDLVLADPGPERMFDDRVYKRGALTLHALRSALGSDAFFELLRAWVTANRHGSVTTSAFVQHAPDSARGLLDDWLYERPLPKLPSRPGR